MEIRHRDDDEYRKWVASIDRKAFGKIARRLGLLTQLGRDLGMPNVRRIDADISELRSGIYRMYFVVGSDDIATFVAYGNKDTQDRDIDRAQRRAKEL